MIPIRARINYSGRQLVVRRHNYPERGGGYPEALVLTRDLNTIDTGSFSRAAAAPATPPSTSVPAALMPPPRGSRLGAIVFELGVGLFAVSFLISASIYYTLVNSSGIPNYQTIELEMAIAELLMAIGALVAGAGWVLDKRELARVLGLSTQGGQKTRRLAGQIIVVLGALTFFGGALYFSILEFLPYYNITVTLPSWTLSFIYALEGVGVLVVAVGWSIQRSGSTLDKAHVA